MKKKIAIVVLMLVGIYAKAGSCSANANGNWETAATWSCGHVPGAGDDITIPAGITVTVTGNNTVAVGNIAIYGTLKFTNGSKLSLSATSVVNIYSTGSITGGNPGAKMIFPSYTVTGSFSTTGPYYFNNSGQGNGVLPLTLVSFYSQQQNQEVTLYWQTENEEGINSFEIESTGNGTADWQAVGTTPPMASTGGGYSYTFTDPNRLNGDRYYRLKIIDQDGKYVFSKILAVASHQTETFSLKPTLASSSINVSLPESGFAQVSIFNPCGGMVKTLNVENQELDIDVSTLSQGLYFLRVTQGKNSYSAKFLKQ